MTKPVQRMALQTRIPKKLYTDYKIHSVTFGKGTMKGLLGHAVQEFLASKPWENGFHIRQPDMRRKREMEFKPIMFWPEESLSTSVHVCADTLEVSTSSVVYTALLWWSEQHLTSTTSSQV